MKKLIEEKKREKSYVADPRSMALAGGEGGGWSSSKRANMACVSSGARPHTMIVPSADTLMSLRQSALNFT